MVAGGHTVVAKPKEIVRAVWQMGLLFAGNGVAVRRSLEMGLLFAVRWKWGCCSLFAGNGVVVRWCRSGNGVVVI